MTAAVVHRLPPAAVVDRIDFLRDFCRGRRVIHLGCADAGHMERQQRTGTFLHEILAGEARELIGVDVDAPGVEAMRSQGHEVYVADCTDVEQLRALHLQPAEVVLVGELIEHTERSGDLLDGARILVAEGGRLVVTTPNAYGWVNAIAALGRREVNHPDHVHMFTFQTLDTLLRRHGWNTEMVRTYVPRAASSRQRIGEPTASRLLAVAARATLLVESLVARLVSPYVADGLIVVARPD